MNFSNIKIHCSSASKLTIEPKSKADKDAGNLSETAKTHLIEVYTEHKYGFRRDNANKYTEKGNKQEPKAIEQLSIFTGLNLKKNELKFENDYFIGTPDCVVPEKQIIFDTKCCYDWITLFDNIQDGLPDENERQIQAYLDILGWETGYVAKILLNHPEEDIEYAKYRLLNSGKYISEESPQFIKDWQEKEKMMRFEQHPLEERILLFPVQKDPDYIEKAKQKVEKARLFLQDFDNKHQNFNKNLVF